MFFCFSCLPFTVKRKLGFGKLGLGHKRTGSNDSKVSQGPFSLLGRSKQNAADQNTVCINGSHVYSEEHEHKTGSTLSLNSSGKGSVEDVRRQHERNISDASTDSFKALQIPSYKPEAQERKTSVQQQHLREEEERESEAKRLAEEKRRQAESKRIQEMLDRQENQEKKRVQERQKKMEEEEERRRKREEEERKKLEEQERQRQEEEVKQAKEQERRRQEEARRAEEQQHHEETRVTDRLSSLFGLGKKKEEKKEEQQQPQPAPRRSFKELEIPASTNPFEEISLTPDPPATVQGLTDAQRGVLSPHAPGNGFPSRTAKVSAVKPR